MAVLKPTSCVSQSKANSKFLWYFHTFRRSCHHQLWVLMSFCLLCEQRRVKGFMNCWLGSGLLLLLHNFTTCEKVSLGVRVDRDLRTWEWITSTHLASNFPITGDWHCQRHLEISDWVEAKCATWFKGTVCFLDENHSYLSQRGVLEFGNTFVQLCSEQSPKSTRNMSSVMFQMGCKVSVSIASVSLYLGLKLQLAHTQRKTQLLTTCVSISF